MGGAAYSQSQYSTSISERTPRRLKNHCHGWSSHFTIPGFCPDRSRHSTSSLKCVLSLPTPLCSNNRTPHQIIMCTTCTQHLINKPTTGPFRMSHPLPFPWKIMCWTYTKAWLNFSFFLEHQLWAINIMTECIPELAFCSPPLNQALFQITESQSHFNVLLVFPTPS